MPPKWKDGRRWCPDCAAYLDPAQFPARSVSPKRPDGLGTYCEHHQKLRNAARREHERNTRGNGSTAMIYGSIPNADREAAEDRRWFGRTVYYLGMRDPVPGRIAGVRETDHQGLQVWVEFEHGLRVSRSELVGVALFKALYLAFPARDYQPPEQQPPKPKPVPYIQLQPPNSWEVGT